MLQNTFRSNYQLILVLFVILSFLLTAYSQLMRTDNLTVPVMSSVKTRNPDKINFSEKYGFSNYLTKNLGWIPAGNTNLLPDMNVAESGLFTDSKNFSAASFMLVPPPNDFFSNAQVISGASGSASGTTIEAGREPGEPNHGNFSEGVGVRSVWYRWTAPQTGRVNFTINGSGANICIDSKNKVIAVYTGSSPSSLALVTKATASCEIPAAVEFQAAQGQEYKIAIDGYVFSSFGGFYQGINFSFSWTIASCSTPIQLIRDQAINASLSTSDCYNGSKYYDDYTFNGVANDRVTISMKSRSLGMNIFDTYLELYNSSGILLAFDDKGEDGINDSTITITLPANDTYTIRATSRFPNATGDYRISYDTAVFLQSFDVTGTLNNLPTTVGVTVRVSGTVSGDCAIFSNRYTCSQLPIYGNFTITPSHPSATFDPPSKTYFNLTSNFTNQNFTANSVISPANASISNKSVTEGNSGTTAMNFTVSLSSASSQNVTVNYSTSGGTATAGQDYQTVTNGTVMIPAGSLSGTATVQVIGDTIVEPDETFTVTLSNPQGATIAAGQGSATGTIINDDIGGSIQFSASSYTVNEGSGSAVITVTRTNGAASNVSVNYAASNGTAQAGQDYTLTSGSLTFGASESIKTFTVPIINDSLSEPDETINLTLSNAAGGGTLGTPATAVLTIIDNDGVRRLSAFDFDGDGRADFGVFRPTTGTWYLQRSSAGLNSVNFGLSSDLITPADFDGDGKTDIAVFRPSSGTWFLQQSQLGFSAIQFGQAGDIPAAADFDGDGKADITVVRRVNGASIWYIFASSQGFYGVQFGTDTDKLAPADFDGDGKTDIAVFRPSNGVWYLLRSQAGFTAYQFGIAEDKPVAADFDGDSRADIAVFRPSNRAWYLQQSQTGFTSLGFGGEGDKPVINALFP